MMLQHLHVLHLVRRDVVAGHGILPAHQVEALNIEGIDGLALILDAAVGLHLQTGHLADDVSYGAVLRLLEAGHGIRQGVSPLGNAFRFGHHFPKLESRFRQHDVLSFPKIFHRYGECLITDKADGQSVRPLHVLQGEMSILPHGRKGQYLACIRVEHDIGSRKRLAGRIVHGSLERQGRLGHPPCHSEDT